MIELFVVFFLTVDLDLSNNEGKSRAAHISQRLNLTVIIQTCCYNFTILVFFFNFYFWIKSNISLNNFTNRHYQELNMNLKHNIKLSIMMKGTVIGPDWSCKKCYLLTYVLKKCTDLYISNIFVYLFLTFSHIFKTY